MLRSEISGKNIRLIGYAVKVLAHAWIRNIVETTGTGVGAVPTPHQRVVSFGHGCRIGHAQPCSVFCLVRRVSISIVEHDVTTIGPAVVGNGAGGDIRLRFRGESGRGRGPNKAKRRQARPRADLSTESIPRLDIAPVRSNLLQRNGSYVQQPRLLFISSLSLLRLAAAREVPVVSQAFPLGFDLEHRILTTVGDVVFGLLIYPRDLRVSGFRKARRRFSACRRACGASGGSGQQHRDRGTFYYLRG